MIDWSLYTFSFPTPRLTLTIGRSEMFWFEITFLWWGVGLNHVPDERQSWNEIWSGLD